MFQAGDDSTLFLSQELSSASDLMQTLDAKGDQMIRRRTYYLSVLGGKSSYVTDFKGVPSVTLMSGANLWLLFFCAVL